jgi:hypothetical protein
MSVSRCTCTRDGEGWTETRGCPVHDDTLALRQGETIHRMTVQIATLRHTLETVRAECELPDYIAEFVGDALASLGEARDVRA